MVPKDPKEWYRGPWGPVPEEYDFWSYYEAVNKRETIGSSMVLFGSPGEIPHELAHYVACKDNDVLDPFWGVEMPDPRVFTPLEIEAEVFVIQVLIEHWWEPSLPWRHGQYIVSNAMSFWTWKPGDPDRATVARWMQKAKKKWSIEKIWAEVQRKDRLVNQLLGG